MAGQPTHFLFTVANAVGSMMRPVQLEKFNGTNWLLFGELLSGSNS
jgi:hypothetical protein